MMRLVASTGGVYPRTPILKTAKSQRNRSPWTGIGGRLGIDRKRNEAKIAAKVSSAMTNLTPGPDSSGKRRGRLRMIGVLILLLGLGGAGAVYWSGAPPQDLSSDPATARDYKTETRDIEINFGKAGLILNDITAGLQRPDVQAAIIALVSILAAFGCFCFAHWLERGGEPDDRAG
jgi:hypothetical protein